MDNDEFQGLFKKYSPLFISLVGIIFLIAIRDYKRSLYLLLAGLAMQYFWMRLRYK
ncbi:MAG: hypothetical protein NWF06_06720 [Candidatus Bathyarchaeota archaeon]|nr:hypothetical protein [Candidatus Bathyarchaeum sp.]